MKANIYRNIKVNARTAVAALLLCSGMVACNDVMEDSLKYDYPATDIRACFAGGSGWCERNVYDVGKECRESP